MLCVWALGESGRQSATLFSRKMDFPQDIAVSGNRKICGDFPYSGW
jgi:hypothetical protein